ncbi:hypothetical protein BOX15_Mlig024271g1 [Macrostomum lignano]|uniref:FYVE-type domain-containing protein n=1 Tax=Macrostomum lignano TaxID=282301 RepID=A0A267EGY5_9PLAT|nr:hypothetical protein BOX15_Mlig008541g1 [Macrostomum lignano]PAA69126.1 hypothetical protein BOX15_Mlig024271g1 [Macrostomum lignano]
MSTAVQRNTSQASNSKFRKPELIFRIEKLVSGDPLNDFAILPKETGIIAVYEDRSVRVLLRRDNGQFWPSVCQFLSSPCSSLAYSEESRSLFVGCDSGLVSEFSLAEDYNSVELRREYQAHNGRVTACIHAIHQEWVISCAKDRYLVWHSVQTGRRCGSYLAGAPCTALQYDHPTRYAFLSDQSGVVTILRLTENSLELINVLKGHSAAVTDLAWDARRNQLYSASQDNAVIMWDIGGGEGKAYELQAHRGSVNSLVFAATSRECISAGSDGNLVFWCMSVPRRETPSWSESDVCSKCGVPFFWNLRKMWSDKRVGTRQHHCRRCGAAVCDACSQRRTALPPMGFEYSVRVCDDCHAEVTPDDLTPLAAVFEAKQDVQKMALCETRRWLLSLGKEGTVKVWDLASVLLPSAD